MSRRKLLITLLAVAMLGFGALSLTACGENNGGATSEPPTTHTHDWNEFVSKEATCETKGEVLYSCYCGENYTVEVPALEHRIKFIQAKAPTCTEIGWKAYEICERNGCEYTTYEGIKANGHDFKKGVCVVDGCGVKEPPENHITHEWDEGQITTTPTCIEKGIKTFTCWCTEKYTEAVDKLEHDREQHEAKEATCTKIGWEAYETCKRDGCEYTTYVEIEINPDNHIIEDEACTDCGKKFYSEGLGYTLSDDGTYYSVRGIGECKDAEIVIPSTYKGLTVKSIAESAFYGCDILTEVVIPGSVTNIGDCAFYSCDGLTRIEVDESNVNYSSLDGNLYNKGKTELIQYAIGKVATFFIIPHGVTSISDYAFFRCDSLTEVVIPDSVTSIGNHAFYGCDSLTKVVIGDSVTSISDYAFSNCYSLTEVVIPDSVTSIGYEAFSYCRSLTEIILPDSVTNIGNHAFYYCRSLTEIVIPDSVTSIGGLAFACCDNLTKVVIGDSVTSIGDGAFDGCSSLKSITFNGTVAQWNAIEKGYSWNIEVPATEVVCVGGTVSVE